ncbi:MAG: pantetheine-phosphate adenylyltransferase [Clostridia bacterium]|nr:pantetheine-phosphate adenylyltransferase [Clostridia bacterium]
MKAIITGSFDPFTLGHLELVKYACKHYDEVYVVALINEKKQYLFNMEEKKKIIELSISEFENAVADAYGGMTADYMHQKGITHIIRGVRNETDLAYEQNLANKMKEFDDTFETTILKCSNELKEISSSKVRELIRKGKKIVNFVHKNAIKYIENLTEQR